MQSTKGPGSNNVYSRGGAVRPQASLPKSLNGAAIPRFSAPRCERTSPPLCVHIITTRALRVLPWGEKRIETPLVSVVSDTLIQFIPRLHYVDHRSLRTVAA
jgi:hypothetical protein